MTETFQPSAFSPTPSGQTRPHGGGLGMGCAAGQVTFVGAGPGAAEHLTLGALRALETAEVVIYDRLVGPEVLALIPARATLIDVGKEGFGPSTAQSDIHRHIIAFALLGQKVLRLKGGDPGVFGRLDEEIEALEALEIGYRIVPGLTTASVAAASIGQSLTKRGRNAGLRIVTGHDMDGFAEQDWRALAARGAVSAIYMGKRSSRFIQGRLLMHGAAAETEVSVIENVSRADQRVQSGRLQDLPTLCAAATGPAIILLGLAPRDGVARLATTPALLPPYEAQA